MKSDDKEILKDAFADFILIITTVVLLAIPTALGIVYAPVLTTSIFMIVIVALVGWAIFRKLR